MAAADVLMIFEGKMGDPIYLCRQRADFEDTSALLDQFLNHEEDLWTGNGETHLGQATEVQIADFNRDGGLDLKIKYQSGFEVILFNRDDFTNRLSALEQAIADGTATEQDRLDHKFLMGKYQALACKEKDYQAPTVENIETRLNFDSGAPNGKMEHVAARVTSQPIVALVQSQDPKGGTPAGATTIHLPAGSASLDEGTLTTFYNLLVRDGSSYVQPSPQAVRSTQCNPTGDVTDSSDDRFLARLMYNTQIVTPAPDFNRDGIADIVLRPNSGQPYAHVVLDYDRALKATSEEVARLSTALASAQKQLDVLPLNDPRYGGVLQQVEGMTMAHEAAMARQAELVQYGDWAMQAVRGRDTPRLDLNHDGVPERILAIKTDEWGKVDKIALSQPIVRNP